MGTLEYYVLGIFFTVIGVGVLMSGIAAVACDLTWKQYAAMLTVFVITGTSLCVGGYFLQLGGVE